MARSTAKAQPLIDQGVEVVEGDLTDPDAIDRAVRGVQKVYHVAANFRESHQPAAYYHRVNAEAPVHMLAAAKRHGVERFVHTSTIGVHGSVKDIPADENSPFNPGDIYQRTKLEGELHVQDEIKKGFPAVVVRPAGIYGVGDMRFLKLFKTIDSGAFRMLGDGKTLFHVVYGDDLAQGYILCGEKPEALGQTYILAGPRYFTLREMIKHAADALGAPEPTRHWPLAPVMAAAVVINAVCTPLRIKPPLYPRRVRFFTNNRAFKIDKARDELGYDPKVDIAEGLQRTVDWHLEQGHLKPRS